MKPFKNIIAEIAAATIIGSIAVAVVAMVIKFIVWLF